jgi:hypothetical protein
MKHTACNQASGPTLARSPDAFAVAAGLGRTTIFAAIAAGRLRARKIGARTLILDEDGREFLASLPEAGKTA